MPLRWRLAVPIYLWLSHICCRRWGETCLTNLPVTALDNRAAIQKGPESRWNGLTRTLMELEVDKVLHLGRKNPLQWRVLGTDSLGSSSAEKDLVVFVGTSWTCTKSALAAKMTNSILGCTYRSLSQQIKALIASLVAFRTLHPVLGDIA